MNISGRSTLTIKVSERSKQAETPNDQNENPDNFIAINEELDEQITELLSSIKKSEGLLEGDDAEITSNETKPEMKNENETIIIRDDNDSKVEVSVNSDTEMTGNGEIDKQVQENDAIEKGIDENTATEENAEKSNDGIKNNVPSENKTDENREEDKDNLVIPQENKDTAEKPEENEEIVEITDIESEKKDTVSELKEVKGTPTRSSARLAATPTSIRTRRTSKLSENNS